MKFLFLMDPLETVVFEKDTTFILMVGAQARGHEVYYVPVPGISLLDGTVHFKATRVTPQLIKDRPFLIHDSITLSGHDIDAVFVRPDPPFNDLYLANTWLLEHLPKKVQVINSATGIRRVNEKIWASQFTQFAPPTLISSNKDELLTFIATHKNIIAKPTDAFGGQSVFHIHSTDSNAKVILETLSHKYHKHIILQRYIPEAENGDKRILLLNGELLGAVLRVHSAGEHRNNFFAGGKAVATTVTPREKEIIAALKPLLQELKLYFVGIDMLGDYLIEVNVTSPTCLQEMNQLYNVRLEENVIKFVESLCRS